MDIEMDSSPCEEPRVFLSGRTSCLSITFTYFQTANNIMTTWIITSQLTWICWHKLVVQFQGKNQFYITHTFEHNPCSIIVILTNTWAFVNMNESLNHVSCWGELCCYFTKWLKLRLEKSNTDLLILASMKQLLW